MSLLSRLFHQHRWLEIRDVFGIVTRRVCFTCGKTQTRFGTWWVGE